MHKSRLSGLIIDCRTEDLDGASQFWSKALGYPVDHAGNPSDSIYRKLDTGPHGLHIEVQKVAHESRVHIDIEADDIEAEVRRLEKLGAKRLRQVKTWWVMQTPTGQLICVVRPQAEDFGASANRWED